MAGQSSLSHRSPCPCHRHQVLSLTYLFNNNNNNNLNSEFAPPPGVIVDSFGLPLHRSPSPALTPPSPGSPSLSTLGFSVSGEAPSGLENGKINTQPHCFNLILFSLVPRLTYRPLRLVSQGTPTAGRILDLDLGSRSSVVSRLSGPGQVGEI